jgi:hypothetical protein
MALLGLGGDGSSGTAASLMPMEQLLPLLAMMPLPTGGNRHAETARKWLLQGVSATVQPSARQGTDGEGHAMRMGSEVPSSVESHMPGRSEGAAPSNAAEAWRRALAGREIRF